MLLESRELAELSPSTSTKPGGTIPSVGTPLAAAYTTKVLDDDFVEPRCLQPDLSAAGAVEYDGIGVRVRASERIGIGRIGRIVRRRPRLVDVDLSTVERVAVGVAELDAGGQHGRCEQCGRHSVLSLSNVYDVVGSSP